MRGRKRGRTSQNPGDDRPRPRPVRWFEVSPDTPWELASDLRARHGYRGAAALTGLSKEGLRKVVARMTMPNRTTLRVLGELYLTRQGNLMATRTIDGQWDVRKRLIELLPWGEEAAHKALDEIFAFARAHPEHFRFAVEHVHEWMELQVQAEYWAEYRLYGDTRRLRKPRARSAQPKKKTVPDPDPREE